MLCPEGVSLRPTLWEEKEQSGPRRGERHNCLRRCPFSLFLSVYPTLWDRQYIPRGPSLSLGTERKHRGSALHPSPKGSVAVPLWGRQRARKKQRGPFGHILRSLSDREVSSASLPFGDESEAVPQRGRETNILCWKGQSQYFQPFGPPCKDICCCPAILQSKTPL